MLDQVPDILADISRGTSEFSPSPAEIRSLLGESYAGAPPLIVSFTDDSLDESPAVTYALPPSARM